LGLTLASVAVELCVSVPSVAAAERSGRLRDDTEARYVAALTRAARTLAADRQRAKTAELLTLVDSA
jgi:hypothetical protein